jgi:hypothetical protein
MAIPNKQKNSTAILEGAINAWMTVHVQLAAVVKKLEPKLDGAKARVITLMKAGGMESFDSRFGKISLRKKTSTDWEGLAKSLLKQEVIAAELPKWQHESEAYVVAPQSWSGKA